VPADAIFDGHRLAREIDSPNPAVPLPFRRERLVLEVAHRL
jgi:dimethylamine/trimethylamine dehydrogenase